MYVVSFISPANRENYFISRFFVCNVHARWMRRMDATPRRARSQTPILARICFLVAIGIFLFYVYIFIIHVLGGMSTCCYRRRLSWNIRNRLTLVHPSAFLLLPACRLRAFGRQGTAAKYRGVVTQLNSLPYVYRYFVLISLRIRQCVEGSRNRLDNVSRNHIQVIKVRYAII